MNSPTIRNFGAVLGAASMFTVGGLVVSTEDTPAEDYRDFQADAVMLWEAEEAPLWEPWPAVVWVTEGPGQVDDPISREVVPLRTPAPNVIGFQVGDEPQRTVPSFEGVDSPRWTNFSYWAPGAEDPEPILDEMLADYDGDLISVSEYNLTPVRLHVLRYFREQALRLDVPYWQYLNAYAGWETGFEASHSVSDLGWSAFTGQALGYTGHWWFAFNIAPEGHPEATQGGGSILHDLGTWNRTGRFWDVARINGSLRRFGEVLHGGFVDWRSDSISITDDLVSGTFGPWLTMHVSQHHTATGSEAEVEVQVPAGFEVLHLDGRTTIDEPVTIPAGGAVLVIDPAIHLFG